MYAVIKILNMFLDGNFFFPYLPSTFSFDIYYYL